MRALLFIALACRLALGADLTPTEVLKSRSPNGHFALYYEEIPNHAGGVPEFAMYFRENGMARASAQLNADLHGNADGGPLDSKISGDSATRALLNTICRCDDFHLSGTLFDPAFSYCVTWTPDSRWVVIEGGARNIWHMMAYQLVGGRFRQVDLSTVSLQIESCFNTQLARPTFLELGIDKGITAEWGQNHVGHNVSWLGDGRFAVLGYPFLSEKTALNRLEEDGKVYFVIDCSNCHRVKVVGMAH